MPSSECRSPVFHWLRLVVRQTMIDLYRRHLATGKRDMRREVSAHRKSVLLGKNARLLGSSSTDVEPPFQKAIRAELVAQLHEARAQLSPRDQQVIALRHDNGQSNAQIAAVLGISEKAASICYFRALKRLRRLLD